MLSAQSSCYRLLLRVTDDKSRIISKLFPQSQLIATPEDHNVEFFLTRYLSNTLKWLFCRNQKMFFFIHDSTGKESCNKLMRKRLQRDCPLLGNQWRRINQYLLVKRDLQCKYRKENCCDLVTQRNVLVNVITC